MKPRFNVIILPQAESDSQQIYNWLHKRSPQGAENWYQALVDAVENIAQQGEIYGLAPEAEHLKRTVQQKLFRTPKGRTYRIMYEIEKDNLFLLHIRTPGQKLTRDRAIRRNGYFGIHPSSILSDVIPLASPQSNASQFERCQNKEACGRSSSIPIRLRPSLESTIRAEHDSGWITSGQSRCGLLVRLRSTESVDTVCETGVLNTGGTAISSPHRTGSWMKRETLSATSIAPHPHPVRH